MVQLLPIGLTLDIKENYLQVYQEVGKEQAQD